MKYARTSGRGREGEGAMIKAGYPYKPNFIAPIHETHASLLIKAPARGEIKKDGYTQCFFEGDSYRN